MKDIVNNLDKEFIELDQKEKLNISSIEDLIIKNITEYKQFLQNHIEELLQQKIDENKIIIKKNKNGKIVDIISVTKGKKN